MKLTNATIDILKNFANINKGLFFKQGHVLRTINGDKSILAEANIEENIPSSFAIYELNQLLALISLHENAPEFDIKGNDLIITRSDGRSKSVFRTCSPDLITMPPDKNLSMTGAEINFTVSQIDFDWVLKTTSIIVAPNVVFESDGTTVRMIGIDVKDDSSQSNSLDVAAGNGDTFRFVFKVTNFKLMPGNYEVTISSKGISNFKNKNLDLQYWVATEPGSTYTKA